MPRLRKKSLKKPVKGEYSKVVVALILLVAVVFTSAVLLVFLITKQEPTELIRYFFVMVIGELWLVAGIKKKKIKEKVGDVKKDIKSIDRQDTYDDTDISMRGDG